MIDFIIGYFKYEANGALIGSMQKERRCYFGSLTIFVFLGHPFSRKRYFLWS